MSFLSATIFGLPVLASRPAFLPYLHRSVRAARRVPGPLCPAAPVRLRPADVLVRPFQVGVPPFPPLRPLWARGGVFRADGVCRSSPPVSGPCGLGLAVCGGRCRLSSVRHSRACHVHCPDPRLGLHMPSPSRPARLGCVQCLALVVAVPVMWRARSSGRCCDIALCGLSECRVRPWPVVSLVEFPAPVRLLSMCVSFAAPECAGVLLLVFALSCRRAFRAVLSACLSSVSLLWPRSVVVVRDCLVMVSWYVSPLRISFVACCGSALAVCLNAFPSYVVSLLFCLPLYSLLVPPSSCSAAQLA